MSDPTAPVPGPEPEPGVPTSGETPAGDAAPRDGTGGDASSLDGRGGDVAPNNATDGVRQVPGVEGNGAASDISIGEGTDAARRVRVRGAARFDDLLAAAGVSDPWEGPGGSRRYVPDLSLLEDILAIPVREGARSQSGLYGRALDAWLAHEFRRAGFEADSVWPRASDPRVLPQEIGRLLEVLPDRVARAMRERLLRATSVAPQDARIRGRAYVKQVDVGISSWTTGPELLLSTKALNSSFGNNLANRFEEAYGDAGNLRARYPLAAVGFAFFVRSTILDEPHMLARAVDMVNKLRDRGDGNGYTSTCLVVTHWSPDGSVSVMPDAVPDHLGAGPFMEALIDVILGYAPVTEHTRVRDLRAGGPIG